MVHLFSSCFHNTPWLLAAQCPSTEELEHGSETFGQLTQLATYTCDTGYVLVGPSSRECVYAYGGEQREWNGGSSPPCTCMYYTLGFDKLCFFVGPLFFLNILKKSAYYSSLVNLLFNYYSTHGHQTPFKNIIKK